MKSMLGRKYSQMKNVYQLKTQMMPPYLMN